MSLQTQLADLTRQKKIAAKELHRTYLRTKRGVKRSLSVDRIIRRHLGASLGAAAIAGLMLAPAPSRHAKSDAEAMHKGHKPWKKSSRKLSWALSLVRSVLPQAVAYIPGLAQPKNDPPAAESDPDPEKTTKKEKPRTLRSVIGPLLLDMASLLLQNVNFQALWNAWTGRNKSPSEDCREGHSAETEAPNVAPPQVQDIPPTATI